MDQTRFDAIARALGAGLNRRAGIRAAVVAVAGMVAGGRAVPEADAGKAGKQGPASEKRPCGPKASDNRCKEDKDCCTSYCKQGKGGKTGRCRCIKRGKKCKNGQTCCGGSVCRNKKCAPKCTVCASGCAFNSVAAAYAAAAPGAVITIDSGTYPTEILITKDITLQACGGADDVVLTPTRATAISSDSYYVVLGEDIVDTTTKRAVTVEGLRFVASSPAGIDDEVMIYSYTNGTVSWTVRNCTSTGAVGAIYAYNGTQVVETSTFTGGYYGAYFYMDDPAASVTVTGCTLSANLSSGLISEGGVTTLTGCTVNGNQNGGVGLQNGIMTITDTTVTGNSDGAWGGGVWVYADDGNSTITFSGSTVVTGNSAPDAAGFGIDEESYTVTVNGVSSSNVYGNTVGDQCARTTDDGLTFTPVANCAF